MVIFYLFETIILMILNSVNKSSFIKIGTTGISLTTVTICINALNILHNSKCSRSYKSCNFMIERCYRMVKAYNK